MYNRNLLGRPTLITPDEVIFHASTDSVADPRLIMQSIIPAEERFIAQALGDDFYQDFINQKNTLVTAGNQAGLLVLINADLTARGLPTIIAADIPEGIYINAIEFVTDTDYVALWNRMLWKLTAECVDLLTTPMSWLRHTGQGQQKNNPEVIGGNGQNSVTGDRGDVKFKMSTMQQDRIDPLIEAMSLWLCKNKIANSNKYPLYSAVCEGLDSVDGVSVLRKTPIIFGAYDDDIDINCTFGL